ncbi:hypothetical protein CEXT_671431 [Caerostris extrusa]|uniref:protein-tyrosine-phosphatase n=1 Tax=Caerostris extrusa TaxID=172846 RepID=A0AAV4NDT1_CAEEX|nr:hypothetical protein CEXT_671431 [Caerostris extrusa]
MYSRLAHSIQFLVLEQAYLKKAGVLVHCHAGVSRSPAICLAYLMSTAKTSLNSCYDYLMKIQPNISPNFGFLTDLEEYGKSLPFDLPDNDFTNLSNVQLEALLHKN